MNPFVGYKVLRFPERIAEWMRTGTTEGPVGVDLDLTNRCPHNCERCPGEWRQSPNGQLTVTEAKGYIDEFVAVGSKAINFGGGGDPLAHPDAADIIDYAATKGLSVGVMTNGTPLAPDKVERLARCCSWIRISLDACDAARHSLVHGVGPEEFPKIVDNIRRLAEIADRKAIVGVSVLTEDRMRSQIGKMAGYAKSLGVDYIQFRPFNHDFTDVRAELEVAAYRFNDDTFSVHWAALKYELIGGCTEYKKTYHTCHAHNFWAVVNADAQMQVCCDLRLEPHRIGDLREQRLREIWYSKRRRDVCNVIDITTCTPLCRLNQYNLTLAELAEPIVHEAHL